MLEEKEEEEDVVDEDVHEDEDKEEDFLSFIHSFLSFYSEEEGRPKVLKEKERNGGKGKRRRGGLALRGKKYIYVAFHPRITSLRHLGQCR